MKFTVRAGDLAEALSLAGRVIPRAPSLAVYSGVRLSVSAGQLKVTGSDEGETTVTSTLAVADAAVGDAVLLPKPITTFLAKLPAAAQVTVTRGDAPELVVASGDGTPYRFRIMEATFPNTSASKADTRPADLSRLSAAVAAVKDCARKNKLVQLVSDDAGLRLHATDGLRLARAVLPEAGFGPFSGLLPLGVLEQIAESPMTEVQVDRRGRVFAASGAKVTVVTRLVDELFPNVDSVLAGLPDYSTHVPTAALREALSRLASVTEDKRPLVVTLAGDLLELSMESVNLGGGAEQIELPAQVPGEVVFGVNMDFFASAVAGHSAPTLTLSWSGPLAPLFLHSEAPVAVTSVVMPVKLT